LPSACARIAPPSVRATALDASVSAAAGGVEVDRAAAENDGVEHAQRDGAAADERQGPGAGVDRGFDLQAAGDGFQPDRAARAGDAGVPGRAGQHRQVARGG
jgi:hypothetical protein